MARRRPWAKPVHTFQFGAQTIRTKVNVMVPAGESPETVDVTAAMHEPTIGHDVFENLFEEEGS